MSGAGLDVGCVQTSAEDGAGKDAERVALAHRWAYGRAPTEEEMRLAMEFLRTPAGPDDKPAPLEQYAQALLASNEFGWGD